MERLTKILFISTIFLVYINIIVCVYRQTIFDSLTDLEMHSAILTMSHTTDISCGRFCDNLNGCISFSFAASTNTCKLYDTDPLIAASDSVATEGSTLYVRDCKSGWMKFGESCYLFSTEHRSWVSSKAYCESVGAQLVKVTNDAEHQFIRQIISSKDENYFWIGARYNSTVGEYRWIDGTNVTFNGWSPGLPGTQKGCVDYLRTFNWLWNSHSNCVSTYCPCICEKRRM
ncbi:perlucin-like protein [Mercenaria mercenaria]|uniref:perlucin-like protein n=1 Tax=Mercenaria mercenaria TaxID=6596 RepID=UPI001E1DB6D6|nr:perlucin-like protein [Mercenaria mercenaria]